MLEVLFQSILSGSINGLIYAMIALGLSVIYGVMYLINFAHGEFVMLAMYFTFWISFFWEIDQTLTFLFTFPVFFLIGALVYYVMIHRTMGTPLSQIALMLGVAMVLHSLVQIVGGTAPKGLPPSFIYGVLTFSTFTITYSRLVTAIVSIIVLTTVHLFLTKTYTGLSMLAASDDRTAAALMGVNVKRIYGLAFGLGLALLTIPAAFLMTFQHADPSAYIRFSLLSWCIVALAGLGRVFSVLPAAIIVGVAESLVVTFIAPEAHLLPIFLIFILVIWFRPKGLFGRR
ncbi:MAG: branched-chain amino acid ABC transporter permease [Candidatus Hadarchaeaceae archaeon]